jgi:hypothetical protein
MNATASVEDVSDVGGVTNILSFIISCQSDNTNIFLFIVILIVAIPTIHFSYLLSLVDFLHPLFLNLH